MQDDQKMQAQPLPEDLAGCAIRLWYRRRPLGWTEDQHLQNPAVNTQNQAEKQLAHTVAKWIRHQHPDSRPGLDLSPLVERAATPAVPAVCTARTVLEAMRIALGLTVPELAVRLGLRRRSLNRWCAGHANPIGQARHILNVFLADHGLGMVYPLQKNETRPAGRRSMA